MKTEMEWTEIRESGTKDIAAFIKHFTATSTFVSEMLNCDAAYRVNDNYEYLRTPASDLSQYSTDSEDDLEFTMNIGGTHYIIGRVIIYSKLYSHRRLTFLVALPQESTDRYYYTEVENFHW